MDNTDKSLLKALVLPRRRHVLAVLRERDHGVSIERLAALVAAAEAESSPDGGPSEEAVIADLHHRHLPNLEQRGIVKIEDDTVRLGDRTALERDPISRFVRRPESVTETEERVLRSLTDDRRRTVLSILGSRDQPISLDDLARRVAARERSIPVTEVDEETTDTVRTSLHHVHLPTLADADLVEYDREEQSLVYSGHPLLDQDDHEAFAAIRDRFPEAHA